MNDYISIPASLNVAIRTPAGLRPTAENSWQIGRYIVCGTLRQSPSFLGEKVPPSPEPVLRARIPLPQKGRPARVHDLVEKVWSVHKERHPLGHYALAAPMASTGRLRLLILASPRPIAWRFLPAPSHNSPSDRLRDFPSPFPPLVWSPILPLALLFT